MLEIPSSLENRPDDYVNYTYSRNGEAPQKVLNGACYATCMPFLSECNFNLFPIKESSLPYDIFCKYIELCKENGIVVPGSITEHDNKCNKLIIPKGSNKHKVYSSLCCYRWSENQPGMAYATVKILENKPKLDFFQAFHYGSALRVYWSLHSFHSIYTTTKKSVYNYDTNNTMDIAASIAIAYFFRQEPKSKKPLVDSCTSTGQTCSEIAKVMQNNLSNIKINNIEKILSPKVTALYQEPLDKNKISEIIEGI